jgi:hypothetical protein
MVNYNQPDIITFIEKNKLGHQICPLMINEDQFLTKCYDTGDKNYKTTVKAYKMFAKYVRHEDRGAMYVEIPHIHNFMMSNNSGSITDIGDKFYRLLGDAASGNMFDVTDIDLCISQKMFTDAKFVKMTNDIIQDTNERVLVALEDFIEKSGDSEDKEIRRSRKKLIEYLDGQHKKIIESHEYLTEMITKVALDNVKMSEVKFGIIFDIHVHEGKMPELLKHVAHNYYDDDFRICHIICGARDDLLTKLIDDKVITITKIFPEIVDMKIFRDLSYTERVQFGELRIKKQDSTNMIAMHTLVPFGKSGYLITGDIQSPPEWSYVPRGMQQDCDEYDTGDLIRAVDRFPFPVQPTDSESYLKYDGIIYLLCFTNETEGEYFKVGMTRGNIKKRLYGYKRENDPYVCVIHKETSDVVNVESNIVTEFNRNFQLFRGREWFKGDKHKMLDIIEKHIKQ